MKKLLLIFAVLALACAGGCSKSTELVDDNPPGNTGGNGDDKGDNDGDDTGNDDGDEDDNKGDGDDTPYVDDIVFDGDGSVPAPVIESAGGQAAIGFTARGSWTAAKDEAIEWLTLAPVSGAEGHAEIVVTAAPHDGEDERNAAVVLRSGSAQRIITVTQKQKDALTLTSNKQEVEADGGRFEIEIMTNIAGFSCEIDASAKSWLSEYAAAETRGIESHTLTFEVKPNMTDKNREGKITVRGGDLSEVITVYQQGLDPRIILTNHTVTVETAGGEVKIELSSNVDNVIMTPPAETWIREVQAQDQTRSLSSFTYTFAVDENTVSKERTAEIVFTAAIGDKTATETVTVTQDPHIVDKVDLFKWPNKEATDGILRAFPGAEGGGMYTTGGRGGRIIHVTNLNDSGEGSLRAALNEKGARTIVFDVAGTIELKSELKIGNGDVTIAGQTAPGDGICLKDYTVQITADNVIIRYVRFRLGDRNATSQEDCIWGRYHKDIILDHCTMTWSIDECASFYANQNFTMQWCLVGESLNNSGHAKGSHGYGGIWGGKNASFHHNLLVHNKSRNARLDHPEIYGVHIASNGSTTFDYIPSHRGNVDFRNNVIYNWGENLTYGGEDGAFNIVGNYYKPGPASKEKKYFVDAYANYKRSDGTVVPYKYGRMFLFDNFNSKYPEMSNNQENSIYLHDGADVGDVDNMFLSAQLPIMKDMYICYTTTHMAIHAYEQVLDHVGASLRRDAVDAHIIYDARNGMATYSLGSNGSSGGIIDSQNDVGGWPLLKATEAEISRATTDTDGDGIPDYYEKLFGLDYEDASDAQAKTLDDRYTNFEMYLHYLVQNTVAAQVADGVNMALQ